MGEDRSERRPWNRGGENGIVQTCPRQEHRQPKGADIGARSQAYRPLHRGRGASHPRTSASARSQAGIVSRNLFATRVRELVGGDAMLEAFINPLLAGREALSGSAPRLRRLVLKAVRTIWHVGS